MKSKRQQRHEEKTWVAYQKENIVLEKFNKQISPPKRQKNPITVGIRQYSKEIETNK